MTKVWCDSSLKESCYIIEGQKPVITSYHAPVTNNAGEYYALLETLYGCYHQGLKDLDIYMDSQLVVNQCTKGQDGLFIYKTKNPFLKKLRDITLDQINTWFDSVKLIYIPREENLAGKVLERRK